MSSNVPPLHIIERTAKLCGVSVGEILGDRRSEKIMHARSVAIFVTCQMRNDLSYSVIGRCFRGRDHSTIMKSEKRGKAYYSVDPKFREMADMVMLDVSKWEPPAMMESVVVEGARV